MAQQKEPGRIIETDQKLKTINPEEYTHQRTIYVEPPPAQKLSLVRKLAEVMAAVGWIEKTGYNEFHKYKYTQEADLVSALRGELAKRHIMVFPNVVDNKRSPHTVTTFKGPRETHLTDVVIQWTFVDGESGEERTIRIDGVGEDNVDKGFYKAFTGSEKYMLMKTFLIPTGDDPERASKEEAEEAKEIGRQAATAKGKERIAELEAKKGKKDAPSAPNAQQSYIPSLFVTPQGNDKYSITGDESLMRQLWKQFKDSYMAHGKCYLITGEQLNALQFQCQEGNIPLSQLKGAQ